MSDARALPDLGILYDDTIPDALFRPFADAISAPGLVIRVESRPAPGPLAGIVWLFPTIVVLYVARSYFDGFLKEAGR